MGCLGIGTVVSGIANANANSSAAQSNAANTVDVNNLNYGEFLQNRGYNGSAVLPRYMVPGYTNPNGTPQTEEESLSQDAINAYNASGANNPAALLAQYQALAAQFQPMETQANNVAAGIFNGNLQSQELQNYAPVAAALQTGVQTQNEASIEGLQQTLNQIKSIQAGQGFSGDSFGSNLLTANAMQASNIQRAQNQANVNTQVAGAQQGIKQGVINTQLGNLSLPGSMLSSNINFANAPANATTAQVGQGQQLFNMFRIGTGNFQYQNLPTVQANPSIAGVLGTAGNGVGSSIGNYLATNPNNIFGGGNNAMAPAGSANGYLGNGQWDNTTLPEDATDFGTINPGAVGEAQAVNSAVSSSAAGGGFADGDF
jgi:hypothetical protein